MRRDCQVCLLIIAALILAPSASAAPFSPEAEADYQAAVAYWGQGEPARCSTLMRELVPPSEIEGNAGEATQPAPGTLVTCSLRISDTLQPCEVPGVMRHEVGHLLGYGHSGNPADAMYRVAPTPECTAEHVAWLWEQARRESAHCPHVRSRLYRHQCRNSVATFQRWAAEAEA